MKMSWAPDDVVWTTGVVIGLISIVVVWFW